MNTKLLQLMQAIPDEGSLEKLNTTLIDLKLIPQTKYEIVQSKEIIERNGAVWQFVTLECELTLTDAESGESIVNTALGMGIDKQDKAVVYAQEMAREIAWKLALNLSSEVEVIRADKPQEIIVETPESKLITTIKALWKWDPTQLPSWIEQRFKKPMEQLNVVELDVVRKELEDYGKQR